MSESIRKSRPGRSIFRLLLAPLQFVFVALREAVHGLLEVLAVLFPERGGGRRNRDFENAGRDSARVVRRRASGTAFREGERARKQEIMDAERENRRFMNAGGTKAVEYREQLTKRKLDYSRGKSVNHLAMVNDKARKARNAADKPRAK